MFEGQFFPKQPIQFEGSGKKIALPFSLAYGSTSVQDAPASSPHSFTGMTIGAAPSGGQTRHVVAAIGLMHNSAGSIDSVTIGGISATLVVGIDSGTGAAGAGVALYIAEVPTGTTAIVAVSFTNGTSVGAATYILMNKTADTANSSSTVEDPTLNLNIAAGGVAIGVSMVRDGTVSTWTGLTEDFDTDIRSNEWFSGAHGGSAGTPASVSLSRGTSSQKAAAVASFA